MMTSFWRMSPIAIVNEHVVIRGTSLLIKISIMPTFCAVINCGTVGGSGYSMYRFPPKYRQGKFCSLSSERLEKWVQALNRSDMTEKKIKYERVCSKHFISGKKAALLDKYNPDWIPSVNMGYVNITDQKNISPIDTYYAYAYLHHEVKLEIME